MQQPELQEQISLFFDCWRTIEGLYAEHAKASGLTYLGLSIMYAIYESSEECTQKLICEKTHLPKQSINVVIKSFLDAGYIEMNETKTDRRNKAIKLTELGRKYAEETVGLLINAERRAMEQLTNQQRLDTIDLLNKMTESLKESINSVKYTKLEKSEEL